MALFQLCLLYGGDKGIKFPGVSPYKDTNPIIRALPSWPHLNLPPKDSISTLSYKGTPSWHMNWNDCLMAHPIFHFPSLSLSLLLLVLLELCPHNLTALKLCLKLSFQQETRLRSWHWNWGTHWPAIKKTVASGKWRLSKRLSTAQGNDGNCHAGLCGARLSSRTEAGEVEWV